MATAQQRRRDGRMADGDGDAGLGVAGRARQRRDVTEFFQEVFHTKNPMGKIVRLQSLGIR
uniref:Uncharacterized protein n=1 Tax=Oryza sativa subsp. japonica TaxID=39947 RepID=Q6ZA04_ORYSJ|nr:hypothetical protein [Oryza sativa Japonica Group]